VCCKLYIYLYLCCLPSSNSFGGHTFSFASTRLLFHFSHTIRVLCSLEPLAKMRLTLMFSLAVFATVNYGLALPGPHGKNSSIFPEIDS
jgi:hypothetical protein